MESPESLRLGDQLPKNDPHAVSVHLPKWRHNVGWAERDPEVLDAMKTGYPRFFIPRVVIKLSEQLLSICTPTGNSEITALSFASIDYANWFSKHLRKDTISLNKNMFQLYLVPWGRTPTGLPLNLTREDAAVFISEHQEYLFLVSFPTELMVKARKLVQHSGYAISSRRATHWLEHAPVLLRNGKFSVMPLITPDPSPTEPEFAHESIQHDRGTEREGMLLSPDTLKRGCTLCQTSNKLGTLARTPDGYLTSPSEAAMTLRWRIATLMGCKCQLQTPNNNRSGDPDANPHFDEATLNPDTDVFLYPAGMAAISAAIDAVISPDIPNPRAAVVGFLYLDTIKLLNVILGEENVTIVSYDQLDWFEAHLKDGNKYTAVFTEFPGNPLLQSPDLARLRALSFEHDFKLIVDDTIGTAATLSLLDHCDLVCTSLTKMFSGGCNVMGGSVVVNPKNAAERRDHLRERLKLVDPGRQVYFGQDILMMEKNSMDFAERVSKASGNAEAMYDVFKGSGKAVKKVSYPKGSSTQDIYEAYQKQKGVGYGFLMSIEFWEVKQAVAFYDAFEVAKGPSLGTNFTLCCPYSILAHYRELEWAESHGVVPHLVRISFGLEGREWVEGRVRKALEAAESA